jgi:hypothetical protein
MKIKLSSMLACAAVLTVAAGAGDAHSGAPLSGLAIGVFKTGALALEQLRPSKTRTCLRLR